MHACFLCYEPSKDVENILDKTHRKDIFQISNEMHSASEGEIGSISSVRSKSGLMTNITRGIVKAALNFTYFDQSLRSLSFIDSVQRIVLVDHNGTATADSSSSSNNNYVPKDSFANLQSFKNAIAGKSGSLVESVNGTKVFVSYQKTN